ncbi:MAG: glycoside hydrolase family 15 protein [Candidatus Paceibacterota bacterium]
MNSKHLILKTLTLGNGNILINFDKFGQVRDFYYPYIGLENHIGNHLLHSIGVYVNGAQSWLNDGYWQIKVDCDSDTFSGKFTAFNEGLGIELRFVDVVYNEKNIFIRRAIVHNHSEDEREIKVFFYQQFELYESRMAHTAYYDPEHKAIIHYRNKRAFLIGGQLEGRDCSDFTTGVFESDGKEGSYIDVTDGQLAKNPIEHGQVDSVIAFAANFKPAEEKFLYYWVNVGLSVEEVRELDNYIKHKGAGYLIKTTQDFWHAWVTRRDFSFYGLSSEVVSLFNKSLFYIRVHADVDGGIIASGDSSMLHMGKDTYAYVWPRDAAYACRALDQVGDFNVTERFYQFCNEVITPDGYFMHKYSPDKSLGSSWHGWLQPNGEFQLPIQEDETAIVLIVLWDHYRLSKNLEFIEAIYNSLIKKAADFMVTFRDEEMLLPKPSFGLWEEKFGIHTYTAATVYGALIAAANFSRLLGKTKSENRYIRAAKEIKSGILQYLYNTDEGIFYKMINKNENGEIIADRTPDVSTFFGLFNFGVLTPDDPKMMAVAEQMKREAVPKTDLGGFCRYKDDRYYRQPDSRHCNPWFVTTFWYAQWLIAKAKNEKDLAEVKEILAWSVRYAQTSGILSEQLDASSGRQLSATPLVWSHAEFVMTVVQYLNKLEEFGICQAANPID